MADDSTFRLKRISYNGRDVPVLMQNENGPCPLLGLSNVLLLRGDISIHPDVPETKEQLEDKDPVYDFKYSSPTGPSVSWSSCNNGMDIEVKMVMYNIQFIVQFLKDDVPWCPIDFSDQKILHQPPEPQICSI